jgi:outer membrane protein TolC
MNVRTSASWLACALAAVALLSAAGCAVTPDPLRAEEREKLAAEARRQLFEGQEAILAPLTLAEATARALKYQAEQRQRQMEEAAAAAQLEVARFDLLPKLVANAGYTTRSNEAFGFGTTPQGTIAATPSASVERSHTTTSLGLTWNLLDFGVSYFRAKQLADQKLIAEERRRKAVQTLMHDVRVAWWRAEAAERLLPPADRLLADVERAIEKTRLIEARRLLPPIQIATLRRALLDLNQQIAFRRQDLAQAKLDLATLVNSPPGSDVRIASPRSEAREILDLTTDLDRLERLALAQRPEMAEEGYRARISENEARKSLVALLPGLSFDLSRMHDSNRFLLNNSWTAAGVTVVFNLIKVFSLPALKRSAEAQRAADDARRQAMAMAVMAQLRLAAIRYALVSDEFLVWDEAARDDDLIVEYVASSEQAGIDNELELIRTRARAMASHINRDLAYANVQASIARLYNSVGYDAVPQNDQAGPLEGLAKLVEQRYGELERASFSARAPQNRPSLGLGTVEGTDARIGALLREGVERVLKSANYPVVGGGADIILGFKLDSAEPREGRVAARVAVSAVPRAGAVVTREFKTTLSEPIDDEQWRVMGEGAAYRVVGDLGSVRITRPFLRIAERIEPRAPVVEDGGLRAADDTLALRIASELALEGAGENATSSGTHER